MKTVGSEQMRLLLLFLGGGIIRTGGGAAESRGGESDASAGIEWTLLPGDGGRIRPAMLSGVEPANPASGEDVYFLLWTRQNPSTAERQALNSSCAASFELFRPQRRTVVLIHGFGDSADESTMYPLMRDALLASGDFNVFGVDWSRLAAAPWYDVAARNTLVAAARTAALIDRLAATAGARVADFHLIGFSLGAHVAGVAAGKVAAGRIPRITGLDPAQVLYRSVPEDERLDGSDADLVEVIHTSGGYLGFVEAIGHRDFFPNGGFWPQPGCILDFVAACSHQRAYRYLAEAVSRGSGFAATRCTDWAAYKAGLCDSDETIPVWNDRDSSVVGKFFLDTNGEEPFSRE